METTNADDVVQRGWDLYRRSIREEVEPEHEGRFLVVDVDSGRYVVADDEVDAFDRAREQMPTGTFYLVRVGRRTAHRIGRWVSAQVRGRVSDDAREATITVTVLSGRSDRSSVEVRAVIDTGFTGGLALPPELVSSLSLPERGFVEVRLADGSATALRLHDASILWHGVPRRVLVYQVDADALVGMALLRGSTVSIDIVSGGHVTITGPMDGGGGDPTRAG